MNNEELIDIKTLRPFRRFIYTIGELPSSYLMSMTYEEQLIWLCNYLSQTVIPALNNNGLAVEELQAKYVELKSYVDDYFENLDVQEEVNNKLDEMVEDGTLEQLIAEYLQLQTSYTYNTIAEMKLSENLANGTFVRTSGFYAYNDGGGAYYKVRTITSGDDINEMNLFALYDENLVAELININANVKQYGAKGNDDHDDTENIQLALDQNSILHIPTGIYKTTKPLNINNSNVIITGDGKTNSYIKKYGTTSYNLQVDYESETVDYSLTPSVINLIFPEDNNISNIKIKDLGIYADNNTNIGIYAPHISYCSFEFVRIQHVVKGLVFSGWINKLLNSDLLEISNNGVEGINTIFNIINGVHGNKIAVSNAKGLYINNSAFDNGNPCFEIIDSESVFINNTSTETNNMVLRNTNSFIVADCCDLEGHSNSNLDLFGGFFINQSNGKTIIKNSNIHFDDYNSYGNPNNKTLVQNTNGSVELTNNKITTPYTYTTYLTGSSTVKIDDKVESTIATEIKKTGRFTKTDDSTTVEVMRLPFTYGKNYAINVKSWGFGPYHTAININTQMCACANAGNTGLSADVDYVIAKPPGNTYNSYLHLEYDSDHNELVLQYKSTNAYGSTIYFEIEYTNN